nr:MAG TPA: hypothetical protein [Caudoviricetes sp.]
MHIKRESISPLNYFTGIGLQNNPCCQYSTK